MAENVRPYLNLGKHLNKLSNFYYCTSYKEMCVTNYVSNEISKSRKRKYAFIIFPSNTLNVRRLLNLQNLHQIT